MGEREWLFICPKKKLYLLSLYPVHSSDFLFLFVVSSMEVFNHSNIDVFISIILM